MRVTVNDASLGESGSKLLKVAATSLLYGVTRSLSEAYDRASHRRKGPVLPQGQSRSGVLQAISDSEEAVRGE